VVSQQGNLFIGCAEVTMLVSFPVLSCPANCSFIFVQCLASSSLSGLDPSFFCILFLLRECNRPFTMHQRALAGRLSYTTLDLLASRTRFFTSTAFAQTDPRRRSPFSSPSFGPSVLFFLPVVFTVWPPFVFVFFPLSYPGSWLILPLRPFSVPIFSCTRYGPSYYL